MHGQQGHLHSPLLALPFAIAQQLTFPMGHCLLRVILPLGTSPAVCWRSAFAPLGQLGPKFQFSCFLGEYSIY